MKALWKEHALVGSVIRKSTVKPDETQLCRGGFERVVIRMPQEDIGSQTNGIARAFAISMTHSA